MIAPARPVAARESGGRPPLRRVAAILAVLVVLGGLALTAGRPGSGRPYDPGDTGPRGLAGMIELLRSSGVHVDISTDLPNDRTTPLFVPVASPAGSDADELLSWVRSGGTLVVAGGAAVHGLERRPGPVSDGFGATAREAGCSAPALEPVEQIEHAAWDGFALPEDDSLACFRLDDEAAWLVEREHGEGRIVALGSPDPFVNSYLDRGDNAVLAAALLGPASGDRLVVRPLPSVGSGDESVADVVPDGFWRLLILASAAVVVAIVWAGRRLGRPVAERLPPVLPSAELTRSVAGLLQRAGDRRTAAERLRDDARRHAEMAVGQPRGSSPPRLVDHLVAVGAIDRATARDALLDGEVPDDQELQRVAEACRALRHALSTPRATGEPAAASGVDDGSAASAAATSAHEGGGGDHDEDMER